MAIAPPHHAYAEMIIERKVNCYIGQNGMFPRLERPKFPDGYGFTHATPHEPEAWEAIVRRVQASRNYWIGSISPDGFPHTMPVWAVWHDGALYFLTKRASRKAKNLLANPKVSVHLESGDDVVVFRGRALPVEDTKRAAEVADSYAEKYDGDEYLPDIEVFFQLQPIVAFTWLERDFHRTATRWRF